MADVSVAPNRVRSGQRTVAGPVLVVGAVPGDLVVELAGGSPYGIRRQPSWESRCTYRRGHDPVWVGTA